MVGKAADPSLFELYMDDGTLLYSGSQTYSKTGNLRDKYPQGCSYLPFSFFILHQTTQDLLLYNLWPNTCKQTEKKKQGNQVWNKKYQLFLWQNYSKNKQSTNNKIHLHQKTSKQLGRPNPLQHKDHSTPLLLRMTLCTTETSIRRPCFCWTTRREDLVSWSGENIEFVYCNATIKVCTFCKVEV